MNETFVTAKQVSASLPLAKVYLAIRAKDRLEFEKALELSSRDGGLYIKFENGYEAHLYVDGGVGLITPSCDDGKFFATFEQFTAYYLAKFW